MTRPRRSASQAFGMALEVRTMCCRLSGNDVLTAVT